jgi:cbb3-type cytochrome oxidase maturation protein
LAILIAAVAVGAFAWAARKGQFDDLETPAHRMLIDDDPVEQDGSANPSDLDTSPQRNHED